MNRGEYEEARKLYLRSLPLLEKTVGPEHPATATTLGNLCITSSHSVSLDAMPLCRRALSVREKVYGPNHPEVARSLSELGLLYAKEGDLARAESLLRRALRIDNSLPESPAARDIGTLAVDDFRLASKDAERLRLASCVADNALIAHFRQDHPTLLPQSWQ